MATRIRCPNPACHFSFDESQAGETGRCPACGSECGLSSTGETDSPGSAIRAVSDGPLSSPSKNLPWEIPKDAIVGGRFRVIGKLGEGGMGAVYLAEDGRLRRKVALKVPHPHLYENNPIFLERLYREAQIAARFHHTRICPIYDIGKSAGRHFIVMHYVEGETLAARMACRSFEPDEAAKMIRSVAETLQKAHDEKIIHRDLKPSNLMIGPGGELIIMDFGLAKRTDDEPEDGARTIDGTFVGTLVYAPPEQVEGRIDELGPGSDIYSLGVVLYELLAGRLPFQGPRYALMRLILATEPDPPSRYSPRVNAELDAIVRKAMAKKVADRYSSMSQFAAALADYLEGTAQGPAEPPSARSSSKPASAAPPPSPWAEPVQEPEAPEVVIPFEDDEFELHADGPSTASPAASASSEATSPAPAEYLSRQSGMTLIHIRPGTFVMGSSVGDDDEKPPHEVRLTSGFYLGKYPVTQREYETVCGRSSGYFKGDPRKPVEQVSWLDAILFCNLISAKEGLTPFYSIKDGEVTVPEWRSPGYRLPTEAEWEYACRAGRTSAFGFGDDPTKLDGYAWHAGNSGGQTHKVGSRRPNAWGLHDMHGNVWEWCWDWYEPRYYQRGANVDPRGPGSPRKFRSLRGGHWGDKPEDLRSANRIWFEPSIRVRFIGFRLARSSA
jgi:formylglycine-generating enzyme required for sulfatase activity/predicted Ser/Thr protein kinase